MNDIALMHVLEAALLAAGRPVPLAQLVELFDEHARPTPEQVAEALAALAADYAGRALELREVASGWRVQVRPAVADVVSRLWQERPTRYSRALLETLALIAYRQPVTRAEIEEVRGVGISQTIMRTLHERNWIRVVGHREVPGRPELLGTTREFLDYFGLRSLDDLPTLAELHDLEEGSLPLELPPGGAVAAALPSPEPAEGEPAAVEAGAAAASDDAADDTVDDGEDDAGDEAPPDAPPEAPTLVAAPPRGHEF